MNNSGCDTRPHGDPRDCSVCEYHWRCTVLVWTGGIMFLLCLPVFLGAVWWSRRP